MSFVILDDRDFDFKEEGLMNHFVKTDEDIGLTLGNIEKALKILR